MEGKNPPLSSTTLGQFVHKKKFKKSLKIKNDHGADVGIIIVI